MSEAMTKNVMARITQSKVICIFSPNSVSTLKGSYGRN